MVGGSTAFLLSFSFRANSIQLSIVHFIANLCAQCTRNKKKMCVGISANGGSTTGNRLKLNSYMPTRASCHATLAHTKMKSRKLGETKREKKNKNKTHNRTATELKVYMLAAGVQIYKLETTIYEWQH